MPVNEGTDRHMLRRSTKQVEESTVKLDLVLERSAAVGAHHRELPVVVNGITWQFGASALYALDCDFPNKGDYKQVPNTKGEQCDPLCYADPLCTNFVWSKGTCYLKQGGLLYSEATKLPSGSGAVCGVRNLVWQESYTATYALDCDFPFVGDIKQVVSQASQCDSLCVSESQCNSFAWRNGVCFLKKLAQASTFEARRIPGQNVVCGVKKQPGWQGNPFSKTITQWNCDFPFGDYKQVPNQQTLACGSYCNAETQCTHYTWRNGTCYLKKGGAKQSDARTGTAYSGAFCAIKG